MSVPVLASCGVASCETIFSTSVSSSSEFLVPRLLLVEIMSMLIPFDAKSDCSASHCLLLDEQEREGEVERTSPCKVVQ